VRIDDWLLTAAEGGNPATGLDARRGGVASLVVRGRQTRPAVKAVPIQTLAQNGHVTISPMVFRGPVPRASSRSSAGPAVPS
jgi:hypothetical protein